MRSLPALLFALRYYRTLSILLLGLLLPQPADTGGAYRRPAWRDDDHEGCNASPARPIDLP
jgi:hypothetical protein